VISGPRSIALFATLLVVVTAAAFGLSRLYATPRALDLTPPAAYLAAPVPVTADAPAAAPVGGQLVDQRWLEQTSRRTGIPLPALRAYADAQLSGVGGCELGWTTLAGIGWVESHHGTIDDRVLTLDGRSDPPIIGVPLNGRGPVAAIRSTPTSAAWHGDEVWERAVGPMQFLRSSWEPWAADGDDDGSATKIELAKAYLDIGDVEGAKGMLEEVLAEAGPAGRAEAQRLLKEIG